MLRKSRDSPSSWSKSGEYGCKGCDTNFHRVVLGKYLAQHSSINFGLRYFHRMKEKVITLSVTDSEMEKATKQLVTNGGGIQNKIKLSGLKLKH